MDFDPSSATSLLDLQPDIPRGDDHDLQNPCLSNLHRSIFSFPSSESSGKNCSPGGGVVDEPVTAAAGPEELAAAGVTGILFFSHGSSPDGLTFLLLLPVFSLLRRRRRRPTLNCEETGATDTAGPHGARGRVRRRRNDEVEVRTEVEVDCGIGDTELGLEL